MALEDASFHYCFAPVFNGHTFHLFLMQLVEAYKGRKIFLIIDNGPCHWLDDEGKRWLEENGQLIELFRLPPYSPEFNAIEGVWKVTRKTTTHNRFYHAVINVNTLIESEANGQTNGDREAALQVAQISEQRSDLD